MYWDLIDVSLRIPLFCHAGLEELAPYLIRGHPGEVLDVLARLSSLRLPSVARLEFTPMKIGAGMTTFLEEHQ